MSFELRLIVVALAAFSAGTLAGSAAAVLMWNRRASANPETRASVVLFWRLLPTIVASAAALLSTAAFLAFEPRDIEPTGRVIAMLAVAAVILVAAGAWRAWRILQTTRRALAEWKLIAEQIALPGIGRPALVVCAPFPIVAIVGVFRPRLIIARSVIEACSSDEIDAILAHERRHVDWHDNLRRALFWTSPDPLAWLPVSRRMLSAWHDATEEAADDRAERLGPHGRVNLAQALIRVARLARMSHESGLPASALFRGENVDARVRRLVAPAPTAAGRQRVPIGWQIALALTAAVAAATALGGVYELIEVAVTILP